VTPTGRPSYSGPRSRCHDQQRRESRRIHATHLAEAGVAPPRADLVQQERVAVLRIDQHVDGEEQGGYGGGPSGSTRNSAARWPNGWRVNTFNAGLAFAALVARLDSPALAQW